MTIGNAQILKSRISSISAFKSAIGSKSYETIRGSMPLLYFRSISKDIEDFSLDIPDDMTVSGICDIIAERHSVPRQTVRLIHKGNFLEASTPAASLPSSPSDPIGFYGKRHRQAASALAPAPPLSPAPASQKPDDPCPDVIPLQEAIDRLTALGFDRSDCHRALQLAGSVEAAAELLISGNLTERTLSGLPPGFPSEEIIYQAFLSSPRHFAKLQSGRTAAITVSAAGITSHFDVTPEQMNSYLLRKYGIGLAQFQPNVAESRRHIQSYGGVERTGSTHEQRMEGIWPRMYQSLPPQEAAMVQTLVQEGFEFPVVVRVYFGCDRNFVATRATLHNIFAS
jgi:hypothetical protein